jgi:adenylate cyclase
MLIRWRAVRGKLIHEAGGETYELGEISTLGRSRDAVVPVGDPRASRQHALIRRQPDGYWFFDLGSSNGSYINERRVTTAQLLRNDDVVRIGDCEMRFEGSIPVVDAAMDTLSHQTLIGVRSRDAVILVSDIEGFTALSEQLAPDELAPVIGSWYSAVGRVLDGHGATVDKFIGDCVLAYWMDTSVPVRREALRAALALQRVAEEVERAHEATLGRVGLAFRTGAAIHLGPVAYGAISAGEFTLLGDAVNLAFRLEALTREYDRRVLVSGDFLAGWETGAGHCEPCGRRQVKGRSEPVEVFAAVSIPD